MHEMLQKSTGLWGTHPSRMPELHACPCVMVCVFLMNFPLGHQITIVEFVVALVAVFFLIGSLLNPFCVPPTC